MSVRFRASALSVINPLNVALRYTNTSVNSLPDADPLPSGKFRSALMPLVSRAHGRSTTTASKSISWEREEGWGNSAPRHSIFTSEEIQFKMNRRKVNTGAATASSYSQRFSFPALARMDRCLFIRGHFQKGGLRSMGWDMCRVGACARFLCRFKKKPFFFRLLCFPSRSNRGAVLLWWASGRCGFTACSHTRRALCTGKSPRRRTTFTNEVKEHQSEVDADERQSQQIAAAGRPRIIDRLTRQTVPSKNPLLSQKVQPDKCIVPNKNLLKLK